MEILEKRMRKDHIMWDYDNPRGNPSSLSLERRALIQMMKIMETIGIVIAYPGLQKMQQRDRGVFGFCVFGFTQNNEEKVAQMLVGDTNIEVLLQWQLDWYDGMKSLMEVLSRDSCIGKEAKDDVEEIVETFLRELQESGWSGPEVPFCSICLQQ